MPTIHPTAILEGDIELADDVTIGPFCYLRGPILVGAGTQIFPSCVIGTEGEHKIRPPTGVIRIGAGAIIRELTVIQRGTGDHETTVGDGAFLMDHCHVAHDVLIERNVTVSPNVTFGGHSHILEGATIGIGAMTHQFSTVGAYTMVGMGAVVTRDVPPFCLVVGNPARFQRLNRHALDRNGMREEDLRIEDGRLATDEPRMQACLDAFMRHTRRPPLALS
jgi:UDP-N-acetylglucosamine acyltransferase